jgi:hypothetical protein
LPQLAAPWVFLLEIRTSRAPPEAHACSHGIKSNLVI